MHREAFANLVQAVRSGKISEEQLNDSVERILQMKQRFGLLNPAPAELDALGISVKTAEHLALSRKLAQKAITLVRDPQKLLPLKNTALLVETSAVRDLTASIGLNGDTLQVDTQPTTAQVAEVLRAADNGRVVIVPVDDLSINQHQLKLIQMLREVGEPVIVLAHRNPFDVALLPENVTILVTYGFNPPIREALADVLLGRVQASGKLSVTLS
jgi:beta-N-acetylhexosaminidase